MRINIALITVAVFMLSLVQAEAVQIDMSDYMDMDVGYQEMFTEGQTVRIDVSITFTGFEGESLIPRIYVWDTEDKAASLIQVPVSEISSQNTKAVKTLNFRPIYSGEEKIHNIKVSAVADLKRLVDGKYKITSDGYIEGEINPIEAVPMLEAYKSVDKTRGLAGDEFIVTVLIKNTGKIDLSVSAYDSIPSGLQKTSGETSWSGTIKAGEQKVIVYTIKAIEAGSFTLPGASVSYSGKILETASLSLAVIPGHVIISGLYPETQSVVPGETADIIAEAENLGSSDVRDVQLLVSTDDDCDRYYSIDIIPAGEKRNITIEVSPKADTNVSVFVIRYAFGSDNILYEEEFYPAVAFIDVEENAVLSGTLSHSGTVQIFKGGEKVFETEGKSFEFTGEPGRYIIGIMSEGCRPYSVSLELGQGRTDMMFSLTEAGIISGTVKDTQGNGVSSTVRIAENCIETETGSGGSFYIYVPAGTYTVMLPEYAESTEAVVLNGKTTQISFSVPASGEEEEPQGEGTNSIIMIVTDLQGNPIEGAKVSADSVSADTDSNGKASFGLGDGEYEFTIEKDYYIVKKFNVSVDKNISWVAGLEKMGENVSEEVPAEDESEPSSVFTPFVIGILLAAIVLIIAFRKEISGFLFSSDEEGKKDAPEPEKEEPKEGKGKGKKPATKKFLGFFKDKITYGLVWDFKWKMRML